MSQRAAQRECSVEALSAEAAARTRTPEEWAADTRRALREALGAHVGQRVHVTVPAPEAHPAQLFEAGRERASVYFHPPTGLAIAGLEVAFECLQDAGLAAQQRAIAERLAGLVVVAPEGAPAPRMFGGLAFAPGASVGTPFAPFGDGLFVMPRVRYAVNPGGGAGTQAWLSFCVTSGADDDALLSDVDGLIQALVRAPKQPGAATAVHVTHLPRERFIGMVSDARAAIAAGDLEKVVLARRSEASVADGALPDAVDMLARLDARFGSCTRFALFRTDTDGERVAFLGATPECLVTRSGDRVHTEALAGSMPRGESAALLASDKDRREHRFVVDAVVSALEPHCTAVTHDPQPGTRELPDVVHMRTPIEGRLRDSASVLTLVGALHPTPAVGGVPREAAVRWIAEREPVPRGWYSAPFGWTDASGDGSFVVALRSGVVRGGRVSVYAGAGIVRDSRPDAEYDETELKMRAVLGTLAGA
ncbi:MAG: isochorismate synthase [Sandaracinaceae bacterium]|jgi:isochorismate synthase|nr:isochorismate synthase [Sandaracinaceae bacterium]MBK7776807.1 isochorismate synthase [Sandaracinaceae bacterium]MBK8410435.1 isochorismate synthase [Sandaracinaceae bacterium]MBK8590457.1 isochorismate synthase [Sandaracinaceae bacterium]